MARAPGFNEASQYNLWQTHRVEVCKLCRIVYVHVLQRIIHWRGPHIYQHRSLHLKCWHLITRVWVGIGCNPWWLHQLTAPTLIIMRTTTCCVVRCSTNHINSLIFRTRAREKKFISSQDERQASCPLMTCFMRTIKLSMQMEYRPTIPALTIWRCHVPHPNEFFNYIYTCACVCYLIYPSIPAHACPGL